MSIFGPLDALRTEVVGGVPAIVFVLLGLVLVNLVTRLANHVMYVRQYEEDGPEAMSRFLPHVFTNVLLVAFAFYFMTVNFFHGLVFVFLVLAVVVTDVFEFEARLVEARKEDPLEFPKSAIAASLVAALHVILLPFLLF